MSEQHKGPIACRDPQCQGGCGLRSILQYGEGALNQQVPTDEEAEEFAREHHLSIERVVNANRGGE